MIGQLFQWRPNPAPERLYIYRVSRPSYSWDNFIAITVVARSEAEARYADPRDEFQIEDDRFSIQPRWPRYPEEKAELKVERIGEAVNMEPGTILCAEFNNG